LEVKESKMPFVAKFQTSNRKIAKYLKDPIICGATEYEVNIFLDASYTQPSFLLRYGSKLIRLKKNWFVVYNYAADDMDFPCYLPSSKVKLY
jgi:hypothetical protein